MKICTRTCFFRHLEKGSLANIVKNLKLLLKYLNLLQQNLIKLNKILKKKDQKLVNLLVNNFQIKF